MRKKKVVTVVKKPKSLFGIIFGAFTMLTTLGLTVFMALGAAGKITIVKQTCTVIYNDRNAKVLYQTEVKEGEDSVYPYPAPTKPPDGERTYTFAGWFPSDKNIQENPTICFPVFVPSDFDVSDLADSLFDKIDPNNLTQDDIDKLQDLLDGLNLPPGLNLSQIFDIDFLEFKTSYEGAVYLRKDSLGEFAYEDGVAKYRHAPEYKAIKNDKITNPLNYTSQLTGTSFEKHPMTIKYLIKKDGINLPAPLYTTTDTTFKYSNNDSYQLNSSAPKEYKTDYVGINYGASNIRNLYANLNSLSEEQIEERRRYNIYAKDTYTNVPSQGALPQLLDKYVGNLDPTSGNVLSQIVKIIKDNVTAVSTGFNLHTNTATPIEDMLNSENPTGNSNHLASLATYMCRRIGIPARIVDGFRVTTRKNATTKVNIRNMHRWCEAYLDNIGWIAIDPFSKLVGDEDLPDPGDGPLNIHIENSNPGSYVEKTYDGAPFKVNFTFDELQLRVGDELRYDTSKIDELYRCGIHTLKLKFIVWDTFMNQDVSKDYNFETEQKVSFIIKPKTIKIKTPSVKVSLKKDSKLGYPYFDDLMKLRSKFELEDPNSLPKNDQLKFLHRFDNMNFSEIPRSEGKYINKIINLNVNKYDYEYDPEIGGDLIQNPVDVTRSFDIIYDFGTIEVVKE